MKKVAIITMIGNNFGNRLQNYALQEYLKDKGINVETIYNCVYDIPKVQYNIFEIPQKVYAKIKRRVLDKRYFSITKKRNMLFENFNKENITFSKIKLDNIDKLKYLDKEYDKFIVGSDQVWNPYANRNKEIDFLKFSNRSKNLTYAVSFGIDKLEEKYVKEYKDGIKNFEFISVREAEGKKIVEKLAGRKDVQVVLDPTMLLSKDRWEEVLNEPEAFENLKGKKYILKYFLGDLSKSREKEIERVAKENKCEIVDILDKNSQFYECGPREFLFLERNAFLICTDSFHSCVFGILFKTPFIVFEREDNVKSMSSRIDNLLKIFELKNRCYKGKISAELLKCDYEHIDKILMKERKKSEKYIIRALGMEEK